MTTPREHEDTIASNEPSSLVCPEGDFHITSFASQEERQSMKEAHELAKALDDSEKLSKKRPSSASSLSSSSMSSSTPGAFSGSTRRAAFPRDKFGGSSASLLTSQTSHSRLDTTTPGSGSSVRRLNSGHHKQEVLEHQKFGLSSSGAAPSLTTAAEEPAHNDHQEEDIQLPSSRSQSDEEGGSPEVLITAAEVYEETSEEMQQKEAQLEEQIRQRIINQSVQATNIVVQANDVENQQQDQPSSDGNLDANNEDSNKQSSLAMALFLALLIVIIVVVALAVTLTGGYDDEEASTATNPPTPAPQLGDNWPPADTVLAHVPETLCLERMPLFGVTRLCNTSSQVLGSAITNLVAQSRLWNFPQADLTILNAAEVRCDVPTGPFTRAKGQCLLPFNNTLVLLEIAGGPLRAAMERALQKIVDDYALTPNGQISGGSYPYGAGIRWQVNMSESFPNRLSHIQIQSPHSYSNNDNPKQQAEATSSRNSNDDDHYEWVPLDETKVYTVLTSSWLADGGDGYNEFHRLDPNLVNDTGVDALSAFIDYCQEHQVLEEPPLDLYSTQAYTNDLYNWTWVWDR